MKNMRKKLNDVADFIDEQLKTGATASTDRTSRRPAPDADQSQPCQTSLEDWQHASLTAFFHWQSQTVRTYQQQNTKKQQLASILNSTKLQKAGGKPGFHHPCATSCKVSFGGANMERMELACGLAKFRMKEYSEVM